VRIPGPSSGDRDVARTVCPVCGAWIGDARATDLDGRASQAGDDVASGRDATLSDRDQTASDDDQTMSDQDQTSSDSDQRSSDDDQAAADDDRAAGSDKATYDRTTHARAGATDDRRAASEVRDETGAMRLGAAADRDHAADLRDLGAADRDDAAHARDVEVDPAAAHDDVVVRATRDRERAADDRQRAADDRAQAAADRQAAARDREESLRIRSESAVLLTQAATDQLTGARMRYFGLDEVSRELARVSRTGSQLMLAFVDVDGLKHVNDSKGHLAGDALLRLVGETLRAHLRPYDVIVRYGGDEFVCAMPNIGAPEARARFQKMAHALAAIKAEHSISFGLAQAQPEETLEALIARADADFLEARRARDNPA
jgi:diguanylate cyclase (GGDEF)-like protein